MEVQAKIFMQKDISKIKLQATKDYGAQVTFCKNRQEAEERAEAQIKSGAFLLPPFDHDQVTCGQGTACLEPLEQIENSIDAVFAPCGGGGLLSGTLIAAKGLTKSTLVIGSEPAQANDAAQTLKQGNIFRWDDSPITLADGAKTLSVTPRPLRYLKQLDNFFEISEDQIIYWTQWICHLLKHHCEPTSSLGMAAAHQWLAQQKETKSVLIILPGGNMDKKAINTIWEKDHLISPPCVYTETG